MASFGGNNQNSSSGSGSGIPGGFGSFSIPDVSRIDPNKITKHRSPDFIKVSGRDTFTSLSFNAGVMWLGGYASAGAYGFREGWRGAASSNYKIRFNSVMNAVSKRGSNVANSLAVIAILHTFTHRTLNDLQIEEYSPIDKILNVRITSPAIAGAITGGLFMSSRGPRAAALAAAIGSGASCAYCIGLPWLQYNVFGWY